MIRELCEDIKSFLEDYKIVWQGVLVVVLVIFCVWVLYFGGLGILPVRRAYVPNPSLGLPPRPHSEAVVKIPETMPVSGPVRVVRTSQVVSVPDEVRIDAPRRFVVRRPPPIVRYEEAVPSTRPATGLVAEECEDEW